MIFKDIKKCWQIVIPLFSSKQNLLERNITIIDDEKVYSDNTVVAEKLNIFFVEAEQCLEIQPYLSEAKRNACAGNIDEIIKQCEQQPSILQIKENVNITDKFIFDDTTPQDINKRILDLDLKKASIENDIPIKILIRSNDIVAKHLAKIYNDSKDNENYPCSLKLGTITPINKKTTTIRLKKDYRPVSLIPIISKLYEKSMYDQIYAHVDKFLSPYLFGYRKNHSTEQCLTIMIEVWKKALDYKNSAGAVLTDLSKAFDCLNHDLLIAKLQAIKFIYDYIKERQQRTNINNSYSSWKNIQYGVSQGSILGPLLLNIFINDIFFFIKKNKIANYADDNTTYTSEGNIESLLKTLQEETSTVLKWFNVNEMKSNNDKCHLIVANETMFLLHWETSASKQRIRLNF